MRRAVPAVILICALGVAALAQASFQAKQFEGKIGPRGDRQRLTFTYERLSKSKTLVNDAHFRNLPVECSAPDSDQAVEGVLAAFNQPSAAWVFNKERKIGGRKDFRKIWKGKGVPIEAPDAETGFRGKRAEFRGKFKRRFRKAGGTFSIRWKQIDKSSGDVVYACGTKTRWGATVVKRKR